MMVVFDMREVVLLNENENGRVRIRPAVSH